MDKERELNVQLCEGCLKDLTNGDKIFILHLGILSRDYCSKCRDTIIAYLDALPKKIANYETIY